MLSVEVLHRSTLLASLSFGLMLEDINPFPPCRFAALREGIASMRQVRDAFLN